ncbi:MAG: hypothetical protein H7343_21435 [Undibacterium sp.]|nr:hypothetical protein [Opitutaceae bacterium]
MASWIWLPGLIMSLGWGLRGFIGGGPLGAMIPGALVALSVCVLLNQTGARAAYAAAFGAVGIGFGGQETYGQTVQFLSRPEMLPLGLAGLGVKGAVWGVVGGACVGVGLSVRREHRRFVLGALGLMLVGTFLGWKFIDEPKLLYFSNRLDRPRAELWAGLLMGGVFFLAALAWAGIARLPVRFALAGAVGAGIGFPLGGVLMLAGRLLPLAKDAYPGWKVMEFTFGLCFGAAIGACAYWNRGRLADTAPETSSESPVERASSYPSVVLAVLAAGVIWAAMQLPVRFTYTMAGVGLLGWVLYSERSAWPIAITVTVGAFTLYIVGFFQQRFPAWAPLGWTVLAGTVWATSRLLDRWQNEPAQQVRRVVSGLIWVAVGASYGRTLLLERIDPAQVMVELLFTSLALAVTALLVRLWPPVAENASTL